MNPMLLADFYKLSHRVQYPENTEVVYSTWTPRASRNGINQVVVFGHQAFIKKYLIKYFNDSFFLQPKRDVVANYSRIIKHTLGVAIPDTKHIEDLHDLGYLPLLIKAIPEGTTVPIKTPTLTIQNTHPKFFWLTNFVETLMSSELWPAYTSATIANEYRKILTAAATKSVGDTSFVQFQGHDFSMRGMMGLKAATLSGMGHLLSFAGTDTIPAILGHEEYYNANVEKELVGTSIPATEHSVQCTYGNDDKYLKDMITKVHPSGFVSVVSDGYDFWDVLTRVVPALKQDILARDGRVVIRPDSGDPVKIVCGDPEGATEAERKGAVEMLWDTFGGTTSAQGYKVLDSHVGLIYGDSITMDRARSIVDGLMIKRFASINCVFGIGSYTYQYNTRDTFGFALKSTLAVINGEEKMIFKNPKTDDGTKKSNRGKVAVSYDEFSGFSVHDGLRLAQDIYHPSDNSMNPQSIDLLKPIFKDGKLLVDESLNTIRARLRENDALLRT